MTRPTITTFRLTRRGLLGTGVAAIAAPAFAAEKPVYRDASAPVARRVADLIARMTPEEKVAQLGAFWIGKFGIFDKAGAFSPERAAKPLGNGMGQITRPSDTMGTAQFRTNRFRSLEDSVDTANAIQRFLVESTRLGIPALFHEETAHGLVAADATIFPVPPALASTWDPDLIEQIFTVTARQGRARGATIALSPVIDLMREPRFGRTEEFFSEDPYLTAQMGIAAVRGLQGRTRPLARDRMYATLKHFVHGSPRGGLNLAPADISDRSLRETYLVPFQQTIRAADPAIVMPSYNEVEGMPAHANRHLLLSTGRARLGFRGVYMSDYGGITNLVTQHHVAADDAAAAALAINAGVDCELPDGKAFAHLPALVKAGKVSQARIDDAVGRVLALKFEAGLFERPYADAKLARKASAMPGDVSLARAAAQKAIVLLKNDGVLPLDPRSAMKLAVIGPNAMNPELGGYTGENQASIGVLAGIMGAARGVTVRHAEGVRISQPIEHGTAGPKNVIPVSAAVNDALIEEARKIAADADVLILALGDKHVITRESVRPEEPGDRSTLNLYGEQDRLVEAMIETGKPIVALLIAGRPLAVTRLAEKASALVECWYLGQEGGNAIADMLFGKINPGGKLTVSLPRSVGELPVYYNRHPTDDENRYVEGKRQPLYPFGFGLSYTSFMLSKPRLSSETIAPGETVGVSVDIVNTGQRAGDEVVQLYIRDEISSAPRPVLELKAFRRISLKPGEKKVIRFDIKPDDLSFWDAEMNWTMEPGIFGIGVGNSSASIQIATLIVS